MLAAHLLPPGFVVPDGYAITDDGIFLRRDGGDLLICRTVVYVSEILWIEKSHRAFWNLRWRAPDGKWRHKLVNPKVCRFSRHIGNLRRLGVAVEVGGAKPLARYFCEFVEVNAGVIPQLSPYPHFGWVEDDGVRKFILSPDEVYFDNGRTVVYLGDKAALWRRGDLSVWRKQVSVWRQERPLARFILAAGFAAPLLGFLPLRSFTLHLYNKEITGKTATAKLTLSIWGDPDEMTVEGHTTDFTLEQIAGLYANLPVLLDEVCFDKLYLDPYGLAAGTGKLRGNNRGGRVEPKRWRTIFLSVGREALITPEKSPGYKRRVLEICGAPFEGVGEARWVHEFVEEHRGLAGPIFIQQLCKVKPEVLEEWLREEYRNIKAYLSEKDPTFTQTETVNQISAIVLADYLASMWVFDIPEKESKEQALRLAAYIASRCEQRAR